MFFKPSCLSLLLQLSFPLPVLANFQPKSHFRFTKDIISDPVAMVDTLNIQPIKNFLPKKCKNVDICLRLMHLSNSVSLSLLLQLPFLLPVLANFQPKCHFRILKDIISDAVATVATKTFKMSLQFCKRHYI